ncbi:transposase [Bacteroidota bacterium]
MKVKKISSKNKLNTFTELEGFDHYFALDWSQDIFSLARVTKRSKTPRWFSGPSKIEILQEQLKKIKGKKILTIEETTSTHWLYVELTEYLDKIIVCDPYRNKLLTEGAKTDDIDAGKLSVLLRGGFLKEVYHSMDESCMIRKLTSAYEDLIKAGVRVKNQKSALFRAMRLRYKVEELSSDNEIIEFISRQQNEAIESYKREKSKYEKEFKKIRKRIPIIGEMCKISGLNTITGVELYAIVTDAERFPNKNKYWGYCGLATHQKTSGKRNYGQRKIRSSKKVKEYI